MIETTYLERDGRGEDAKDLEKVAARGEGLVPRQHLLDLGTQLQVILVKGRQIGRSARPHKRALDVVVGELLTVVGYKGICGILPRERTHEEIAW